MVGVPKSTGCAICRRRKIKCDETWPCCVNCQKNGKCCPGPPARHTFKDSRPRMNSTTTAAEVSGFIRGSLYGAMGNVLPNQPEQSSQRLTQLNEKWSENGAVFHKWRICSPSNDPLPKKHSRGQYGRSALSRQPSPSSQQELSHALIATLSTGVFESFTFIVEVPKRIGQSAALDAAVACLVNAHGAMIRRKKATEIADPKLYLSAVQALQMSLEDPYEGASNNTLCATILLGLVEAMAGPREGNNYLAHAGGAGHLIKLQGPDKFKEQFGKQMLRFSRGGIITQSIYQRKPCFLAAPEWREIAFGVEDTTYEDALYDGVLCLMADFPSLLRECRDLDLCAPQSRSDDFAAFNCDMFNTEEALSSTDFLTPEFTPEFSPVPDIVYTPGSEGELYPDTGGRDVLLKRLRNMKSSLCSLGGRMNMRLADGNAAIELPSIEEGNPVPTAFHFTNWRVAVAYNCFWSLLILTNRVIMRTIPPYDSNYFALEAECRTVAWEICKTWEDAWASRPIGAYHTTLSFVMAYQWVPSSVQVWILKCMNALLDSQAIEPFRWTRNQIVSAGNRLAGEGRDLSKELAVKELS